MKSIKIKNNYKISLILAFFPIICKKLFIMPYSLMIIFFLLSILSIIFVGIGNKIYDEAERIIKFIGKYIAIISLFFIWIFAVLPTGIIIKIIKRDRLRLKKQNINSYWIDNKNKIEYENQF